MVSGRSFFFPSDFCIISYFPSMRFFLCYLLSPDNCFLSRLVSRKKCWGEVLAADFSEKRELVVLPGLIMNHLLSRSCSFFCFFFKSGDMDPLVGPRKQMPHSAVEFFFPRLPAVLRNSINVIPLIP